MKHKNTPNRLKDIRVKLSTSLEEVAGILSVKPTLVEAWERGATLPSSLHLLQLCALYSTTPEALYPDLYQQLRSAIESNRTS